MFKAADPNNEYRVRNLTLEQHWSAILKGDLPSSSCCVSISLSFTFISHCCSPLRRGRIQVKNWGQLP